MAASRPAGRCRPRRGRGGLGFSTFTLELTRSLGGLQDLDGPTWVPWLAVALGALLLVGRRRWPLSVATLAAAHMFVVGITLPEVMAQLSMQIIYFAAYFSGVAWARNRRELVIVIGAVVAFMFIWLAWHFALGRGVDETWAQLDADAARNYGTVQPITAAVLLAALVNVVYFGGAVLAGQLSWRSARQRARLAEQAELLATQGEELRRRAVVEERLRIARELHDVVAHHVSVIGVQAGAARRVLGRGPEHTEAARTALGEIEQSSREAVTQMRGLLGTLRTHEQTDDVHRHRDPADPGGPADPRWRHDDERGSQRFRACLAAGRGPGGHGQAHRQDVRIQHPRHGGPDRRPTRCAGLPGRPHPYLHGRLNTRCRRHGAGDP